MSLMSKILNGYEFDELTCELPYDKGIKQFLNRYWSKNEDAEPLKLRIFI